MRTVGFHLDKGKKSEIKHHLHELRKVADELFMVIVNGHAISWTITIVVGRFTNDSTNLTKTFISQKIIIIIYEYVQFSTVLVSI